MDEEGGGERGGPTVRRKREKGRGVVPLCGGGGKRGEGWSHREEEEGERRRFNFCEITTCSEVPPLDFKSSVVYLMCSALDY